VFPRTGGGTKRRSPAGRHWTAAAAAAVAPPDAHLAPEQPGGRLAERGRPVRVHLTGARAAWGGNCSQAHHTDGRGARLGAAAAADKQYLSPVSDRLLSLGVLARACAN
jgi:hypothetical protein